MRWRARSERKKRKKASCLPLPPNDFTQHVSILCHTRLTLRGMGGRQFYTQCVREGIFNNHISHVHVHILGLSLSFVIIIGLISPRARTLLQIHLRTMRTKSLTDKHKNEKNEEKLCA